MYFPLKFFYYNLYTLKMKITSREIFMKFSAFALMGLGMKKYIVIKNLYPNVYNTSYRKAICFYISSVEREMD